MDPVSHLQAARARLPNFSSIDPASIAASIGELLKTNEIELDALITRDDSAGWEELCAPLEALNDRLSRAWSPIRHLHSVADSDALRSAYNSVLPEVIRYSSAQLQHDGLQAAFQRLHDAESFAELSPSRQQVVKHALRDFRLGGIALDGAKRARFLEVQQRLNQLGTLFEQQVLDATRSWSWHAPGCGSCRSASAGAAGARPRPSSTSS